MKALCYTMVSMAALFTTTLSHELLEDDGRRLVRRKRQDMQSSPQSPLRSMFPSSFTAPSTVASTVTNVSSANTSSVWLDGNRTDVTTARQPAHLSTSIRQNIATTPASSSALSVGAIAGIAVGCSVYVVLMICLFRFVCYWTQRKTSYPVFPTDDTSSIADSTHGSRIQLAEMDQLNYISDRRERANQKRPSKLRRNEVRNDVVSSRDDGFRY